MPPLRCQDSRHVAYAATDAVDADALRRVAAATCLFQDAAISSMLTPLIFMPAAAPSPATRISRAYAGAAAAGASP